MSVRGDQLWAVRDRRNKLIVDTVRYTRTDAIGVWLNFWLPPDPSVREQYQSWRYWYRKGYRCVRVALSEAQP